MQTIYRKASDSAVGIPVAAPLVVNRAHSDVFHGIRASYRLLLHAEFRFDRAAAVVDNLDELGESHTYRSPYPQAATGSMHGYDGVAPDRVNAELGGAAGHERYVRACSTSRPLDATGAGASHVLAFVRGNDRDRYSGNRSARPSRLTMSRVDFP